MQQTLSIPTSTASRQFPLLPTPPPSTSSHLISISSHTRLCRAVQPCPPPLCLSKTQEIASDTPAPGTHVWSICVDKRDNESFVWNVCSLRDSASGKGATRKRHATVWGKFGSVPRLLDPTSAAVAKAWYVGGRRNICDSLTLSSSEYLHQQATTRQKYCNSS